MGKTLHRLIHQFPRLELNAHVQPITRALIKVREEGLMAPKMGCFPHNSFIEVEPDGPYLVISLLCLRRLS